MHQTAYSQASQAIDNATMARNVADRNPEEAAAYGLAGIATGLAALAFELGRANDIAARAAGLDPKSI